MVLHVPIGLPGSGKSTWTRRFLRGDWIASDTIREEMNGGNYRHVPERNGDVFDEFHRRIERRLLVGDVISDATNLKASSRSRLIEIAERCGATIHYIVFTNVNQAILRNAERVGPRRVPDHQMLEFAAQYETMLRDILVEPIHHATYINSLS